MSLVVFVSDFLTWTRLSMTGFTPPPCTKHSSVVVTRHQMSRRNHSMPTFRCSSSAGVDLQRSSTGRARRHQRQTDVATPLNNRSELESRQSVETAMTELSCDGKQTDEASEAERNCCNVCASSLRRSHRVSSDDGDALFNSSREQLIVEPNSSATILPTRTQNGVSFLPSTDCADRHCRCHRGAVNLTFVSDDVAVHHNEVYAASEHSHDHVDAAQALMQPVNGQTTGMASINGEMTPESPIEMSCYSVCRNDRLVVEDLESSCERVVSTLVQQSNSVSRRPLNVREAWPDTNHVPATRHLNDEKQPPPVCIVCLANIGRVQ